jgi:hypothetical protein
MFRDRRAAAVACCWSMPMFGSFIFGQDLPLLLALLAGSLASLKIKRPFQAGAILSLCAIEPHLCLLLPVLILGRGMWRFGIGLLTGGAVLFALSFLAAGPTWIEAFVQTAALSQTNPEIASMPNLNGLVNGSSVWEMIGAFVVCAPLWRVIRCSNLEWAVAVTLVAGVLVSHHAYIADCAILLPALLIAREQASRKWQRTLTLFLITPAAYVWVYFTGLSVLTRTAVILFAISFVAAPERVEALQTVPVDYSENTHQSGLGECEASEY